MTDKAYIVVNEQQESEVLDKLEREGLTWCGGEEANQIIPSDCYFGAFPYVIFVGEWLSWNKVSTLEDEEIIYDGQKESKMQISKEVYDALVEWKDEHETELEVSLTKLIDPHEFTYLAAIVDEWWLDSNISNIESKNRLIAIIRWVNGEDVFEVEKWVVRSDSKDSEGDYWYVRLDRNEHNKSNVGYNIETATRFGTKEEAESWANAHQEVIEIEVEA